MFHTPYQMSNFAGCRVSLKSTPSVTVMELPGDSCVMLAVSFRDMPACSRVDPMPAGQGKGQGAWQVSHTHYHTHCTSCMILDHIIHSPRLELLSAFSFIPIPSPCILGMRLNIS